MALPPLPQLAAAALALGLGAPAFAQSNVIPGTDVSLGILNNFSYLNRQGTFPNGTNALAMATTSCNLGSVNVPWFEPMNENHPLIAFLVAREDDNGARMVQISDRSHVKHGFFALSNSQCTPCQVPSNGTFLGIGCSDTYAVSNNANNFYLAPADEIDPWLGSWTATCSFFDAGTAPQPSTQCDGIRTFSFAQSNNLGPVGNRVRVRDADLIPSPSQRFFYASQYVIRGEPEIARRNNLGSRQFVPNWTGSMWTVPTTGLYLAGSVLERWTGAEISSGINGLDDGRVYVAVKVTGPVDGLYHYEYALHNRDNHRGVSELRLPLCNTAGVVNVGFRDVDLNAGNDWSAVTEPGALVFSTTNNPLRWNTIYNFWFDSTAAPVDGLATMGAFAPGAGADSFNAPIQVPGVAYATKIGPGCDSGTPASLVPNGLPALGNGAFSLVSSGNAPAAGLLLYGSTLLGSLPLDGCTGYLGGSFGAEIVLLNTTVADGTGTASLPLPIPLAPGLEGLAFHLQGVTLSGSGPLLGIGGLTDGLRIVLGGATASCE